MANHHHTKNGAKEGQIVVVMVPLPAQGHLNQLLHLSRLVASYDIPVHYVGTAAHNRQAKTRVHGWDLLSVSNIYFHDLPSLDFPTPSPDPNTSNKFPGHLLPSLKASLQLREPVTAMLRQLSSSFRRVVVINDSLMAYVAQDIHSVPNAESYNYPSISAFCTYAYFWEELGQPNRPLEEILHQLPSNEGCFTPEFMEFAEDQFQYRKYHSGNLFNSNREIEGLFLGLLEQDRYSGTDKLWAIGPLNPLEPSSKQRHRCIEWLDKQEPSSVIFVSFGSTTSLSDEQILEMALGLEMSGKKFVWVVRDADKGEVDVSGEDTRRAELPEGFEERVKERGLVVRDWAPQLEVLGHPATGGFMSHCGWNSCMESISMGVPIAAWPMHSDQPRNALLITGVLKVGLMVMEWDCRDEVVRAPKVEEAVKRLMDSEEGDEMRKAAALLGDAVRKSVVEGGTARKEMDSFIAHITR